jgi:hypothetical protein
MGSEALRQISRRSGEGQVTRSGREPLPLTSEAAQDFIGERKELVRERMKDDWKKIFAPEP